jgi:Flp pilus assembly pilin Flp
MKLLLQRLWFDEDGQHLVEYAILLSWIALASVAFLEGWGKSLRGIWTTANSQLSAANTSAS